MPSRQGVHCPQLSCLKNFASRHTGVAAGECRLDDSAVVCGERRIALTDLHAAGSKAGHRFEAKRKAYLSPRSVAFNAHGVRVAVHRITGEIAILQSVHAADVGRLINPMQCRGQVEGGVAQAIGAALFEEVVLDGSGAVANAALRHYRVPTMADLPRTEVLFAETTDPLGPGGAKPMSESPFNPVAAALANAIADATGVRLRAPPFRADRVWRGLRALGEDAGARGGG